MKKFLRHYNELIGLILTTALFIISPVILRLADPTAGSFDIGLIQVGIVAMLIFQVSAIVAWFTFRWNFPGLYDFFDNRMEEALAGTAGDERLPEGLRFKVKVALAIYLTYFLIMAAISYAVISMNIS